MCGIFAILRAAQGANQLRKVAIQQSRKLRHRGPDSSGVYAKGSTILLHERNAIVDPENGEQPLYNARGDIAVVANGEIYNFKDLVAKHQLEKKLKTKSDSEVIIGLYETLGASKEMLNSLIGMFSFVLYDEKRDFFVIARDHMGIIPLYIGWNEDGSIVVASELKALVDVCGKFQEFLPGHYLTSSMQQPQRWYEPKWLLHDQVVEAKRVVKKTDAAIESRAAKDVSSCAHSAVVDAPNANASANTSAASNAAAAGTHAAPNANANANAGATIGAASNVNAIKQIPAAATAHAANDANIPNPGADAHSQNPVGAKEDAAQELDQKLDQASQMLKLESKADFQALREAFTESVRRHLMSDVPYGVLLSGGLDSSLVSAIAVKAAKEAKQGGSVDKLKSFSVGLKGSPDLKAARKVAEFLDTEHHALEFSVQQGTDALSEVVHILETYDVTTIRASIPMFLLARKIRSLGVKMVLSGEGADEIFGGYLYFHKAPSAEELHRETVRKLKSLHLYDCLRANKSTSAWGVEARVPFLDRKFLDFAMNIDPAYKMTSNNDKKIEKFVLRKAFEGYLPEDILWRQKEQFSDGVGYSWIDGLRSYAESQISDEEFEDATKTFPHNTPSTKEAYLYRQIFQSHYPQPSAALCVPGGPSIACSSPKAVEWDASFKKSADPSGRAVKGIHKQAYQVHFKDTVIDAANRAQNKGTAEIASFANNKDAAEAGKPANSNDSAARNPAAVALGDPSSAEHAVESLLSC